MKPTTVAVDLAKDVFDVAVANRHWRITESHRLSRPRFHRFIESLEPTHVAMEACGSAHYWGRLLQRHGHRVSLLPAIYVRPYVRRNKTDRSDAEAILEAVRSGRIPPVAVKSVEQQEIMVLHRMRSRWVATRTARINALRGFLREIGISIPLGARTATTRAAEIADAGEVPVLLARTVRGLLEEICELEIRVKEVESSLRGLATNTWPVTKLLQIPGVGLLSATALVGSVGNIHAFPSGRHFASWLGLTPREHSSGLHRRLGRITKKGNRYLRCLLTHGARATLLAAQRQQRAGKRLTPRQQWVIQVRERVGHNKAAIAMANRTARIIWAVWTRDEDFDAQRMAV